MIGIAAYLYIAFMGSFGTYNITKAYNIVSATATEEPF